MRDVECVVLLASNKKTPNDNLVIAKYDTTNNWLKIPINIFRKDVVLTFGFIPKTKKEKEGKE